MAAERGVTYPPAKGPDHARELTRAPQSPAPYQGQRSAKNYAFVGAVARKNVELTMTDIHRRSAVLADLQTSGAIKIAGAMYNLETGQVDFFA